MKKIAALALLLLCVSFVKAQGNLQFNQILLIDLGPVSTYNINVPPGKVWKIESAATYNGSNSGILLRNAAAQTIGVFSGSNTNATSCFPFWLPSAFSGSFVNNSSAGRVSLSIIEFNVIP